MQIIEAAHGRSCTGKAQSGFLIYLLHKIRPRDHRFCLALLVKASIQQFEGGLPRATRLLLRLLLRLKFTSQLLQHLAPFTKFERTQLSTTDFIEQIKLKMGVQQSKTQTAEVEHG